MPKRKPLHTETRASKSDAFRTLPAPAQRAILVRNLAHILARHAEEAGQTVEAYADEALCADDLTTDERLLVLSAVGYLAAEHDRLGDGPLRLADEARAAVDRRKAGWA